MQLHVSVIPTLLHTWEVEAGAEELPEVCKPANLADSEANKETLFQAKEGASDGHTRLSTGSTHAP